MRILVVSDTHGTTAALRRAILAQPKAEVVIHLGDGEEELLRAKRAFPEKMFLAVRGNCDFGSDLPLTGEFTAQGVKIFYTHRPLLRGEIRPVHLCLRRPGEGRAGGPVRPHPQRSGGLRRRAVSAKPRLFNSWEATYGTVDITPQGIVTNIVKLP